MNLGIESDKIILQQEAQGVLFEYFKFDVYQISFLSDFYFIIFLSGITNNFKSMKIIADGFYAFV